MPTPNRQTVPRGENHLLWSEDFSNAGWTKTFCTITPNTHLALDGTMTASTITATSTAAYISHALATASRVHTCNFDVQKGKNFAIAMSDSSANGYVQGYNGTTGLTVGGGGVGSGWTLRRSWTEDKGTFWRVYLIVDHPQSVASMNITMNTNLGNSWATIYAAAATSPGDTMVFARAQITPTDSPVSYIKTTSSISAPAARRLKPVSQNLQVRSEELTHATYTPSNLTVGAYGGSLPSQYATGFTITESTDGAPTFHTLQVGLYNVTPNRYITFTGVFKANTRSWISLYDVYVGGGSVASFDLANGEVGSVGIGSADMENLGDGWWRCNWYYLPTNNQILLGLMMLSANNTFSYQGNGSSIYGTGFSVAIGNNPGIYKRTTTTAFNIGGLPQIAPRQQNLIPNSNNITIGRSGSATVVDFKTFTLTAAAASNLTTTLTNVGQAQAGQVFTASAVLYTDSGTKTAFMCRLNTASWATATVYPITVTTTPTRFSFQFTPVIGDTINSYFTIGGDFKNAIAPSAGTYYVEDMQVNQGSAITPLKKTVGLYNIGAPRQRVPKAQNLLRYSELITTTWYVISAGITSLTAQPGAPNGTSTVTINTFAVTTSYIYQTTLATLQAGTWVTFSVWLWSPSKATIGIRVSDGNAAGGAQTSIALTNTPTRYSVSFKLTTSGSPICGLDNRVGVAGDGIAGDVHVWGAQLENSNVAGPYIATEATRYNIGNLRLSA